MPQPTPPRTPWARAVAGLFLAGSLAQAQGRIRCDRPFLAAGEGCVLRVDLPEGEARSLRWTVTGPEGRPPLLHPTTDREALFLISPERAGGPCTVAVTDDRDPGFRAKLLFQVRTFPEAGPRHADRRRLTVLWPASGPSLPEDELAAPQTRIRFCENAFDDALDPALRRLDGCWIVAGPTGLQALTPTGEAVPVPGLPALEPGWRCAAVAVMPPGDGSRAPEGPRLVYGLVLDDPDSGRAFRLFALGVDGRHRRWAREDLREAKLTTVRDLALDRDGNVFAVFAERRDLLRLDLAGALIRHAPIPETAAGGREGLLALALDPATENLQVADADGFWNVSPRGAVLPVQEDGRAVRLTPRQEALAHLRAHQRGVREHKRRLRDEREDAAQEAGQEAKEARAYRTAVDRVRRLAPATTGGPAQTRGSFRTRAGVAMGVVTVLQATCRPGRVLAQGEPGMVVPYLSSSDPTSFSSYSASTGGLPGVDALVATCNPVPPRLPPDTPVCATSHLEDLQALAQAVRAEKRRLFIPPETLGPGPCPPKARDLFQKDIQAQYRQFASASNYLGYQLEQDGGELQAAGAILDVVSAGTLPVPANGTFTGTLPALIANAAADETEIVGDSLFGAGFFVLDGGGPYLADAAAARRWAARYTRMANRIEPSPLTCGGAGSLGSLGVDTGLGGPWGPAGFPLQSLFPLLTSLLAQQGTACALLGAQNQPGLVCSSSTFAALAQKNATLAELFNRNLACLDFAPRMGIQAPCRQPPQGADWDPTDALTYLEEFGAETEVAGILGLNVGYFFFGLFDLFNAQAVAATQLGAAAAARGFTATADAMLEAATVGFTVGYGLLKATAATAYWGTVVERAGYARALLRADPPTLPESSSAPGQQVSSSSGTRVLSPPGTPGDSASVPDGPVDPVPQPEGTAQPSSATRVRPPLFFWR